MKNNVLLSPSILNVNLLKLHSYLCDLNGLVDYIHIDVMDGIFVKQRTNGLEMFSEAKRTEKKPFDVHLMVQDPLLEIDNYDGAKIITFHIETVLDEDTMQVDTKKFNKIVSKIRSKGALVGVSVKPNTTVSLLINVLKKIDLVLVMTVEPGLGGQKLIPKTLNKIEQLRKMGFEGLIEVDGGVTVENAKEIREKGVDIIVAGTAIFKSEDMWEAASIIKNG